MNHPANFIDLAGKRFGKLFVIEQAVNQKRTSAYWLCLCDCGTSKVIAGQSLRKGATISCGCHMRQVAKTHGMSKTRVYRIWEGMKERCLNPNRKEFKNYGGRGIELCDSWRKFENFYADMGDPPDNHCIDRIDNDRGYTPGNCRWATHRENNNNTRHNVLITINNETKTVTQWCEYFGVNKNTAFVRILRGWLPEKAVSHLPKSSKN